MSESNDLMPFRMLSYGAADAGHGLLLSEPYMEVGPAAAALEAAGHVSNGYAWAGVARAILADRMGDVADQVSLDPEAGMFAARSPDPEVLRRLGRLMAQAYHDPQSLGPMLARTDPATSDR